MLNLMLQGAFDSLQQVASELRAVQDALDLQLSNYGIVGSDRNLLRETRAQSERTYLLRLLADFEGRLTKLGPALTTPIVFVSSDGLATKLDRIGKSKGVNRTLRLEMDDKIREHRNELFHGRSPVPRVPFSTTHQLMKAFLRECW